MGGGGSQTIEQIFNLSAVNKSIYEQITTNTQKVSQSSANIQTITLNVKGGMIGCPFSASQKISSNKQIDVSMIPETVLAMKNEITTEMQAGAQAAIEKATEAGNLQFGDEQDVKQEINMAIENVVDTTITTKNLSEVISSYVNIQDEGLNVGGDLDCLGYEINFAQEITEKIATKAIMTSLTDALIENKTINNFKSNLDASQKTENKGLADIIAKFFEGITGPIKYALIACVLMICIVIIGLTLFLLSPAGQNSTRTIANAGAKKLGGPF